MEKVRAYSHGELLAILKKAGKMMLLDVRDIDYGEGGVIRGSVNVPSCEFDVDKARRVVRESEKMKVEDIVCYCSYGRARSVQCAGLVRDAVDAQFPAWRVAVGYLAGGFVRFRAWHPDSEYIIPRMKM